jgi:hypothetical protein
MVQWFKPKHATIKQRTAMSESVDIPKPECRLESQHEPQSLVPLRSTLICDTRNGTIWSLRSLNLTLKLSTRSTPSGMSSFDGDGFSCQYRKYDCPHSTFTTTNSHSIGLIVFFRQVDRSLKINKTLAQIGATVSQRLLAEISREKRRLDRKNWRYKMVEVRRL